MPYKKAGRPTKLTPALQKKVVDAIKAGAYIETAAAFAGIHKDTLYEWLKKGARSRGGPFFEFSQAVEQALAHSELRDITIIGTAAQTQWQAAAWRLERRFPERWSRRDKVDMQHGGAVTQNLEGTVKLDISQRIERYAEVFRSLAERGVSAGGNAGDDPGEPVDTA